MTKQQLTYDIYFESETDSISKGFSLSFNDAMSWVINNTDDTYFSDFAGGEVCIVCNQTGMTVFSKPI